MLDRKSFNELVERYLEGTATPDEREFMRQYWKDQARRARLAGVLFGGVSQPNTKMIRWAGAIAASIVVLVTGSKLIGLVGKEAGSFAFDRQVASHRGQQVKIVLIDHTVVWLNADSRLRYPSSFSEKFREVGVEGEAYFEVAKDKKHPFIVHTGELNVRVLGTHFNVKSYKNNHRIEVSLLEGSVLLTASGIIPSKNTLSMLLSPNEKATYWGVAGSPAALTRSNVAGGAGKGIAIGKDNSGETSGRAANHAAETNILKKTRVKAIDEAAWRDGVLVFNGETLQEVVEVLSRKYDRRISLQDHLKGRTLHARLENQSIDQALLSICQVLSRQPSPISKLRVQFRKSGDSYFIE